MKSFSEFINECDMAKLSVDEASNPSIRLSRAFDREKEKRQWRKDNASQNDPVASVHVHIKNNGGVPLTDENIEQHDIHFMDDKFEDRQEISVNAGTGPLRGTAPEMHVFGTPSGQEVHGLFPQSSEIGGAAYEQHPNFPGKRVHTSGIFDVITKHDIPEKDMFGT